MGDAIRFVLLCTMKRGELKKPEVLDDANQWRAFSSWRVDSSREVRVEFELAYDDARVIWRKPPAIADARAERMMRLAGRVG